MELLEGAQPGEPAKQLVKQTPLRATLSKAGVFTKVHPAKLVWANDWSSLMAKRMWGRSFPFCARASGDPLTSSSGERKRKDFMVTGFIGIQSWNSETKNSPGRLFAG
jgi:hypothetical protein